MSFKFSIENDESFDFSIEDSYDPGYTDVIIELDTTRFDASDQNLYSSDGSIVGTVTVSSGTIADNVYTTADGLHVSGLTFGRIDVDLSLAEEWTIEYSIKDYAFDSVASNTVNWILNSANAGLETAAVKDFNSHAVHCRLNGSVNPTLYNCCALSGSGNGFYDFATEPSMLYGFEMNYKWVNDGNTLSLWVNGIKKASLPSQFFAQENISYIGIPNAGNSAGNNRNGMIVTKFKILDHADTTNDRVLYKWHITKFKAYEDWFTVKRLKLYTGDDELIDQNENNYICIFTNGGTSQDGVKNGESLVYSLLGKTQSGGFVPDHGYIYRPNHTATGDVVDVIYSIPASLADVAAYSYVSPSDPNEAYSVRQPVSWTFQKSTDGGETWTTLDTQADVPVPYRGQETQKFTVT